MPDSTKESQKRRLAKIRPHGLDLARAIEFALENNVSIINVSAGQKVASPEADTHLDQAFGGARKGGCLLSRLRAMMVALVCTFQQAYLRSSLSELKTLADTRLTQAIGVKRIDRTGYLPLGTG